MDAAVGNSSSGLYEAPTFGIPTVNIGDRQTGRPRATSVFDCSTERYAVVSAIESALARGRRQTISPYGDGHASERIVSILGDLKPDQLSSRKAFIDIS
jgi:UDP-N-acetylglucosamine 2-epimerase